MSKAPNIIKRSFFDDNDDIENFWREKEFSELSKYELALETTLNVRSKESSVKDLKSVTVCLIGHYLIQKKRKNEKVVKYINLEENFYRVDSIPSNDQRHSQKYKYSFSLYSNGKIMDYYTKDKTVYMKWLLALRNYCLMTNFEENYKTMEMIGSGGYGKVYLVEDYITRKRYAAKMIKTSFLKNKDRQRAMLASEIKIMRRIDNSLICKFYEAHEVDDQIIMIIEHLEGDKLFNFIVQRKKLSERETALIMKQLFLILSYLENKSVIHRDIKPENIIMVKKDENNFRFKLIDFGLATYLEKKNVIRKCGTAGYVAPEILNNENYDFKVDLYSAGVIMYICLSGKPPFHALDYQELLERNRKGVVKFKGQVWSRISQQGKELLGKLLEPIPALRISLEDCINHDWLASQLTAKEKEDLMSHAFKVVKMNIPEEVKIQEVPFTVGTNKSLNMSRSSSKENLLSASSINHTSFITQEPPSPSLNSFYKFASNSGLLSDRSEGSSYSFIRPLSKTVYVNVKSPTLGLPEANALNNNVRVIKKASSATSIPGAQEDENSPSDTTGYKIQISQFSDPGWDVPLEEGSVCFDRYKSLASKNFSFFGGLSSMKNPFSQNSKDKKESMDETPRLKNSKAKIVNKYRVTSRSVTDVGLYENSKKKL